MRHTILFALIALSFAALAQPNNIKFNAGVAYTVGAPTFKPMSTGSRVAIDTATYIWYESLDPNTNQWISKGFWIQEITGCAAPGYTPSKHQSIYVTNTCATPELYKWNGSAWVQIAGSGGGGTVTTDATLTGDGSGGSPLSIAQQSANTSEILTWTGATWEPSWGNPYTFVTTGATITTSVNEILIGTLSASVTMGLPVCSATTDQKHFKFVRNGTDAFSVTIDPNGSQTFYDLTTVKVVFGKLSIDCTCQFSAGTGVWFYDNN